MTSGDIGFLIIVNAAPYLMTSGTAFLTLQQATNPRAPHITLPLTIQNSIYTDPDGTKYPAFTVGTYVTNGTECPMGGIYVSALEVHPAGGAKFTSKLGTFIVNSVMQP